MASRSIATERFQGISWCTGFRNKFKEFDTLARTRRTQINQALEMHDRGTEQYTLGQPQSIYDDIRIV